MVNQCARLCTQNWLKLFTREQGANILEQYIFKNSLILIMNNPVLSEQIFEFQAESFSFTEFETGA